MLIQALMSQNGPEMGQVLEVEIDLCGIPGMNPMILVMKILPTFGEMVEDIGMISGKIDLNML